MSADKANYEEVLTSKALSWMLRHGAIKSGLHLTEDGYANVTELLAFPRFKGCTVETIRKIVADDKKSRYSLKEENGVLMICANQGHSIPIEKLSLRPITSLDDCPQAIHGTFRRNVGGILRDGLKPMSRQHIHFSKIEPSADRDVSGIRPSCDVLVYLDVGRALTDGIPLFESANGVILSPGNASGCVPSAYFLKVVEKKGKDWSEIVMGTPGNCPNSNPSVFRTRKF